MSHVPEHLEHAEHAQHAAHARFDRQVAGSMAIIAALLACLSLLGHQAHNETLRLQIEAGIAKTESADDWSFYQAQNIRDHFYKTMLVLDGAMAKDPQLTADARRLHDDARKHWDDQVAKYKTELPKHEEEARGKDRHSHDLQEESHHVHAQANRFQLAELFTEMALVLCSLALLTKRPPFWYAGLAAGGIGIVLGLTVLGLH